MSALKPLEVQKVYALLTVSVAWSEKRGPSMAESATPEPAGWPRRSSRERRASLNVADESESTGNRALRAAKDFMESRFESPGAAADHWGCER